METLKGALFAIALCGLLGATAGAEERGRRAHGGPGEPARLEGPASDLRQEIQCLNLINALNLTSEQVKKILAVADRRDEIQRQAGARIKGAEEELEALLSKLRIVLEKQTEIPDDLADRVRRVEHRAMRVREEAETELAQTGQELDTILTEGQRAVMESFKPCLIPPRDLRDPVRAGQASDSPIGETALRQVREMSESEFDRQANAIAERGLIRVTEMGKYSDEEKAKERSRLVAVMRKARAMSDVEFEVNKAALAKEFQPTNKVEDLRKQMEVARTGVGPSKAARFLLSPAGVSVLRKRARQTASAARPATARD